MNFVFKHFLFQYEHFSMANIFLSIYRNIQRKEREKEEQQKSFFWDLWTLLLAKKYRPIPFGSESSPSLFFLHSTCTLSLPFLWSCSREKWLTKTGKSLLKRNRSIPSQICIFIAQRTQRWLKSNFASQRSAFAVSFFAVPCVCAHAPTIFTALLKRDAVN